jgi:hypothetical protein
LRQIISRAVVSAEVMDIFGAAGPHSVAIMPTMVAFNTSRRVGVLVLWTVPGWMPITFSNASHNRRRLRSTGR